MLARKNFLFRNAACAMLLFLSLALLFCACGAEREYRKQNEESSLPPDTEELVTAGPETTGPETEPNTTEPEETEPGTSETETTEAETTEAETTCESTGDVTDLETGNEHEEKYSDAFAFIGRSESDVRVYLFEENTEFVYEYKDLPKGQIFAVEFSEEFLASERRSVKTITFKVSGGSNPEKVVTEEGDTRVYLTFDDGPNPKNTERILDILAEYGIKATFFSVGSYVERYPEIVKRVSDEGHKIACHSYTHKYSELYADAESFTAEISMWENAVSDALGFIPSERLFRFPGGSTNCKTPGMKTLLAELGYRGFDWNALNNDCYIKRCPAGMTEDEYLKETFRTTVENSLKMKHAPHIVLMHETYSQTADMLSYAIEYLIERGCTFATLDELESCWYY